MNRRKLWTVLLLALLLAGSVACSGTPAEPLAQEPDPPLAVGSAQVFSRVDVVGTVDASRRATIVAIDLQREPGILWLSDGRSLRSTETTASTCARALPAWPTPFAEAGPDPRTEDIYAQPVDVVVRWRSATNGDRALVRLPGGRRVGTVRDADLTCLPDSVRPGIDRPPLRSTGTADLRLRVTVPDAVTAGRGVWTTVTGVDLTADPPRLRLTDGRILPASALAARASRCVVAAGSMPVQRTGREPGAAELPVDTDVVVPVRWGPDGGTALIRIPRPGGAESFGVAGTDALACS